MNHDTTIAHSPTYMNLSCPQCRREYDVRRATDPLFVEEEDPWPHALAARRRSGTIAAVCLLGAVLVPRAGVVGEVSDPLADLLREITGAQHYAGDRSFSVDELAARLRAAGVTVAPSDPAARDGYTDTNHHDPATPLECPHGALWDGSIWTRVRPDPATPLWTAAQAILVRVDTGSFVDPLWMMQDLFDALRGALQEPTP